MVSVSVDPRRRAILSDFLQLKIAVGFPISDVSQDDKFKQLVQAADSTVKNYCHRDFETQTYTEFPFKGGTPDLPLLQRPLRPVLLTGNLMQGSNLATQLTGQMMYQFAQVISGQTIAVTGAATANVRPAIPPFTTLSNPIANDPTNGNYVTMSNAATVTATGVPLVCGLDVYIDFGGNYGWGLNAFQNGPGKSARLYAGLDYAPEIDMPDGSSKCGLLILWGQSGYGGGLWSLAPLGWGFGGVSGYGPYGGPLTQAMPPVWPTYPGCIRVDYTAGYGVGATAPNGLLPQSTTIPKDLTLAVTSLSAYMWNNADTGMIQVRNESFQGYSRALEEAAKDALEKAQALGSIRDILTRYMEVPL